MDCYDHLEKLHAICVPRVLDSGKFRGQYIIVVEPVTSVVVANLSELEKVKFLDALRAIHRLQKTVRVQACNLICNKNGEAMFLDVSYLENIRHKGHQNADAEHLRKALFEPKQLYKV